MKRLKFGVTLRCELLEMLLKTNVIIGTISLWNLKCNSQKGFYSMNAVGKLQLDSFILIEGYLKLHRAICFNIFRQRTLAQPDVEIKAKKKGYFKSFHGGHFSLLPEDVLMLLLPCTSPPPVPSSRLVYQATFGKNQCALPKIAIPPRWTLRSCFACINKLDDQIRIPEAFNSNSCCYRDFLAESFFNQFHAFTWFS